MADASLQAINLQEQFAKQYPAKGPLHKLENATAENSLFFPGDLDTLDHWVGFSVIKHSRARKQVGGINTLLKTIFLPIPNALGTSYGMAYDSEAIGSAGVAGAAIGDIIANAKSGTIRQRLAEKIGKITKEDIKGAALNVLVQGADQHISALAGSVVTNSAATGIVTAAADVGLKGALFGAGIARNPHMAVLFTGVNFRSHNFSYKLIAKTRKESTAIRQIIKAFKWHMAPEYKASNHEFFAYPEQFEIDFHHPKHLFNIGPSVLTSFEINYHGEGSPAYFASEPLPEIVDPDDTLEGEGESLEVAPVSVTISMSFQEITINTKKDIEDNNR